jgi:uncharacterized paraquat-inducible protein A
MCFDVALNTSNSRIEHECVQWAAMLVLNTSTKGELSVHWCAQCTVMFALNTSNSKTEHECVQCAAMLVLNTSNRRELSKNGCAQCAVMFIMNTS